MNVAIIPARGGSKRIARKNIKEFAGRPIISYSIEAARRAELFERILVSTDDEDIARVARSYGAETPFMRPKHLSDDHTGTSAVVKHAIRWLKEHDITVKYACCIYATAPLIQEKYLQEGFARIVRSGRSYAFSVTTFPYPVQRALAVNESGEMEMLQPEYMHTRSQDLRESFHDAAQFYWGTAEAFLNDVPLFSQAAIPVFIPRQLVQDIDTQEDWICAEMMYRAWRDMEVER